VATTRRGAASPRPGRLRNWLLEGHTKPKQLPGLTAGYIWVGGRLMKSTYAMSEDGGEEGRRDRR
jgi:hypothetical protein